MRIVSSSVALTSSHLATRATHRAESLKLWIGEEPPDRAGAAGRPAAAPAIRAAMAPPPGAREASPAPAGPVEGAQGEEAPGKGTPRDELDLAILRRTFRLGRTLTRGAREIRSAYAEPRAAEGGAASGADAAGDPAPAPRPQREGWGLRYQRTETTVSSQATTFAAAARVTTADGRTIEVQAALAMARTSVTTSELQVRAGDAAKVDPLVLNLAGGAATLGGPTRFDLDADGELETVAALGPGSAYLAMDRDGNGSIDSGAELFGPSTGSGFGELAALDQDGNGWVDEGDAAFASLSLWSPGGAPPSPLAAAGVGAIYARGAATPFDLAGPGGAVAGSVAETGLFLREDGTAGTVQHVDLVA